MFAVACFWTVKCFETSKEISSLQQIDTAILQVALHEDATLDDWRLIAHDRRYLLCADCDASRMLHRVDPSTNTLYLVCLYGDPAPLPSIIKYDLNTNTQDEIDYYNFHMGTAWDVIVRGAYVYGAVYYNPGGMMVMLPLYLNAASAFELSQKPRAEPSYPFFGPHRFIPIQSNRLYIIDEDEWCTDRYIHLVSFADISVADWSQYPAYPNSLFSSYAPC